MSYFIAQLHIINHKYINILEKLLSTAFCRLAHAKHLPVTAPPRVYSSLCCFLWDAQRCVANRSGQSIRPIDQARRSGASIRRGVSRSIAICHTTHHRRLLESLKYNSRCDSVAAVLRFPTPLQLWRKSCTRHGVRAQLVACPRPAADERRAARREWPRDERREADWRGETLVCGEDELCSKSGYRLNENDTLKVELNEH